MLPSQKMAIAAHLHVLLRRKTGRVTDTEWMVQSREYAREVVRFARLHAREDGHADLEEWATRLENAVLGPAPETSTAAAQTTLERLRDRVRLGQREEPEPPEGGPRYVGGIR